MSKSDVVSGKAAPLPIDNVDTDQIIPAEFLKLLSRKGLGKYLFHRWRYDELGNPRVGFVLDEERFRGAKILVAGRNFGIGSSRENAVWALVDFGLEAIVAPSFGDIFYGNAVRNYLACIRLSEENVRTLQEKAASGSLVLRVDLSRQEVTSEEGLCLRFNMEDDIRRKLLLRVNDIDLTMSSVDRISEYERRRPRFLEPDDRVTRLKQLGSDGDRSQGVA